MTEPFFLPIVPRYAEVDQQGVVFNGHYLTWFEEACNAFLENLGLQFEAFAARDLDWQVVHAELDYAAPVRWRDAVRVVAWCESVGTTSFTLRFEVRRRDGSSDGEAEVVAVGGRNVYVVVSTEDWTKREIPTHFREALTSVAGQGRSAKGGGVAKGTVTA